MTKKPKLTPKERDQIAVLLAMGTSIRRMARELGRSASSISEEVKRNSIEGQYQSIAAHEVSTKRNRESRRTNPLKNANIYAYVIGKLRCGWSPEQIAGRLKRNNDGKSIICHETIYRYIYSEERNETSLTT